MTYFEKHVYFYKPIMKFVQVPINQQGYFKGTIYKQKSNDDTEETWRLLSGFLRSFTSSILVLSLCFSTSATII